MGTPTLVLVTGPGGSGKTTLAHRLAATVGCPALCRDEIKEGMVASNPGFVPSASDGLTLRTYDLFFELIALLLAAEVTLVAEAGFQHADAEHFSARRSFQELDLDVPTLDVDTSDGWDPGLAEIADFCRSPSP